MPQTTPTTTGTPAGTGPVTGPPVLDSRVETVERFPLASLHQYPGNPRVGNVDAIAESLDANGQFAPIVVQRSTLRILSGNHTARAAAQLGWTHLDVVIVDVDDDRARRIVAAANRTADLGTYDDPLLAALLTGIADTDLGLEGTGYTDADLDDLVTATTLGDDDGDETGPGPTGAHYAETPDEYDARYAKSDAANARTYTHTTRDHGLAEVNLLMPAHSRDQLTADLDALRPHLGDEPTGLLVCKAVRAAVAHLVPGAAA